MEIDQKQDRGYESVRIDQVGYADPYAKEGAVVLKSYDGREFHMRAFSGEVATHIHSFINKSYDEVPTIYRMVEEICEAGELFLVKIKVYNSGNLLRANLYLTGKKEPVLRNYSVVCRGGIILVCPAGKKDLVLRNYRASDAMAMAALYDIPILVRETLLKEEAAEAR